MSAGMIDYGLGSGVTTVFGAQVQKQWSAPSPILTFVLFSCIIFFWCIAPPCLMCLGAIAPIWPPSVMPLGVGELVQASESWYNNMASRLSCQ